MVIFKCLSLVTGTAVSKRFKELASNKRISVPKMMPFTFLFLGVNKNLMRQNIKIFFSSQA